MKKLSAEERAEHLKRIAAIKDEDIDTSDIPELTAEQFKNGVRGRFYRPQRKNDVLQNDVIRNGKVKPD